VRGCGGWPQTQAQAEAQLEARREELRNARHTVASIVAESQQHARAGALLAEQRCGASILWPSEWCAAARARGGGAQQPPPPPPTPQPTVEQRIRRLRSQLAEAQAWVDRMPQANRSCEAEVKALRAEEDELRSQRVPFILAVSQSASQPASSTRLSRSPTADGCQLRLLASSALLLLLLRCCRHVGAPCHHHHRGGNTHGPHRRCKSWTRVCGAIPPGWRHSPIR
jgi:hypothetical protein